MSHGLIANRLTRAILGRSSSRIWSCCVRPQMSDYPAWADLRAQSRDFLTPWEPLWATDELSRASFRRRVRHYLRDLREDVGYALFIFAASTGVPGRRPDALQRPARRDPILHARLLGRRQIRPAGLYDGCRARRGPVRVRFARVAPAGSGLPADQCRPRSSYWRRPVSSARASRAAICGSTAYGKTICFTRCSTPIRAAERACREPAGRRGRNGGVERLNAR